MSPTITGMPDAEWAVVQALKANPDVATWDADIDVRYEGTLPAVVVERIGGLADYLGVVDHPRLDITVWHTSKALCADFAATVREAVHRMNGQVVGQAVVGSVNEVLGLMFMPDDTTEGSPRYLFTVEITMRALVA